MVERYDAKQYNLALENTDMILKSHPTNPETLAFRALILMGQKKQEEALGLMKDILKKDPKNFKNFTVWHVYGLVHRQAKQFKEARMCLSQALKLDDTNQNVLRDLAGIQLRL